MSAKKKVERKKGARPAPASPSTIYRAARGAPFSDEDAAVIGEELLRIAEANRTDVGSLDERLVWAVVKADPGHPLRRFYNLDRDAAAEAHWIAHTAILIRSIRVVVVQAKPLGEVRPMFLTVPSKRLARDVPDSGTIEARRRSRVLTSDVVKSDPDFGAALSQQLKLIRQAVARYRHIVDMRRSPPPFSTIADKLDAAFEEFDHLRQEILAAE